MNFEEMKNKFKGVKIKAPKNGESNSIGFHNENRTQLVYKSEIVKSNRLGFCIDGNLYIISEDLMKQLKDHVSNNHSHIPFEISYSDERYTIPLKMLKLFGKDAMQTSNAIKSVTTSNTAIYVTNSDIFQSAQTAINNNKLVESLGFYKSFFENEGILIGMLQSQIDQLRKEVTEETIIQMLVCLNLLNEANKN